MTDPLVVEGESTQPIPEVREQLINNLRIIIEWISKRDHDTAVSLDQIVHKLETLAFQRGTAILAEMKRERDAARMDLHRIGAIISNPLRIISDQPALIFDGMRAGDSLVEGEQPNAQPDV